MRFHSGPSVTPCLEIASSAMRTASSRPMLNPGASGGVARRITHPTAPITPSTSNAAVAPRDNATVGCAASGTVEGLQIGACKGADALRSTAPSSVSPRLRATRHTTTASGTSAKATTMKRSNPMPGASATHSGVDMSARSNPKCMRMPGRIPKRRYTRPQTSEGRKSSMGRANDGSWG